MDTKLLMTTFATLFLAELGDKTQLAVIALSASSGKPGTVFVGALAALALVTALGAVFGQGAARLVPEPVLHKAGAAVFMAAGAWLWFH